MTLKSSVIKELMNKMQEKDLLSEDVQEFFEQELSDVKDMGKKVGGGGGGRKKKRVSSSDESEQPPVKAKRTPTPHNNRVGMCMALLKERYPKESGYVHQDRLGAGQYMASYLEDNTESSNEEAMKHAVEKMNERRGVEVFPVSVLEETKDTKKTSSDKQKKATKKATKKVSKTKTVTVSDEDTEEEEKEEEEKEEAEKEEDEKKKTERLVVTNDEEEGNENEEIYDDSDDDDDIVSKLDGILL
jgi:hypothetical protein